MKKFMLILIMWAIATLSYSETLTEWWNSLSKEERIEWVQICKNIAESGETKIINDIEYKITIDDSDIILTPVYPDGQDYYIIEIEGLSIQIQVAVIKIKDAIEKKSFWEDNGPPFLIGAIAGILVYGFINSIAN